MSNAALSALGSPTRRAIIQALSLGPLPVGELAAQLPISRPAVSQHLRVLEEAHLVSHISTGTRHLFQLDRTGFRTAQVWLDSFWLSALDNLKDLAESTWDPTTSDQESR